ncbi:hypothetical protein JJQ72_01985 [Paenibacillus sp. F411]|uniref:Uncharacterized protein n=1 Tax=Paenibacillus algicola TaxID=2565926 RepID=A0A4P8XLB3_9BACL|nr:MULTISPECIES: hypothetical protein [Paenibacillus]MBO2942756.1 hypothetical protein [Paenibacillus sp. F411]QCT03248.1 hypothetical protein E6C60_2536 [Paenibacillus algicola]
MNENQSMNEAYTSAKPKEDTSFQSVDDILAYYGDLHGRDYSVPDKSSR